MRILAIFAHPDDESYGPGATLARYAAEGHHVSLCTMTRGEAGSLGICKELPREEVAEMRSRELRDAAAILGIRDLRIEELPDKQLSGISTSRGARIVLDAIEAQKPDLLLTFHPPGISRHPDHQAVTRWCTEAAFHHPLLRLIYYGITPRLAERIRKFRDVAALEEEEITHLIDAQEYMETKRAAIFCHQSQLELWKTFEEQKEADSYFGGVEAFSQAQPRLKVGTRYDDLALPAMVE